jgi:hypothetical protein
MKRTELKALIKSVVTEEMMNTIQKPDHEGKMAKSELRDMVKLGAELYNMIQEGDNLDGWASAYITLASDYIHSVHQYMIEQKK